MYVLDHIHVGDTFVSDKANPNCLLHTRGSYQASGNSPPGGPGAPHAPTNPYKKPKKQKKPKK